MDIHEISQKLLYVQELLGDLRHHHQSGAHTCPCNICTQKHSLARSIITRALQEVTLIANCLESSGDCDMKCKLTSDLSHSCAPTLASEQESECEILKGNPSELRQHSSDQDVNFDFGLLSNKIREQRNSLSIIKESQRDSGINTSSSSQSASPVLGRCQQRASQSSSKDVLNEIMGCELVEVAHTTQNTNSFDKYFILHKNKCTQVAAGEQSSVVGPAHSQTKCMSVLDNDFHDLHYVHSCRKQSLPFPSSFLGSQSLKSANIASTSLLSSSHCTSDVLVPVPLVPAAPELMQDPERHSQGLGDPNIRVESVPNENSSQVKLIKPASEPTRVQTSAQTGNEHELSEFTEASSSVGLEQICSVGGENFDHVLEWEENPEDHTRQNTDYCEPPLQVKQPCSFSPKESTDIVSSHHIIQESTLLNTSLMDEKVTVKSGGDSSTYKTTYRYAKEEQKLTVSDSESENHRKNILNSNSTLSFQYSLDHLDQQSHICYCKKNIISAHSCYNQHTVSQTCPFYFCDSKCSENCHILDNMWRPWETKDIILGLISSETDGEEKSLVREKSDPPSLVPPSPDLQSDTTPTQRFNGQILTTASDGGRTKVQESEDSDSKPNNSPISCLQTGVNSQNCKNVEQKHKTVSYSEGTASLRRSSSGNNSEATNMNSLKCSSQVSSASATEKYTEKNNRYIHCNGDINSDFRSEPANMGTDADSWLKKVDGKQKHSEEPSAERSLRCLSNMVQSPRKDKRSNLSQNFVAAPKSSHSCQDKENETCVQNPKHCQSPFTQMSHNIHSSDVAGTRDVAVHTHCSLSLNRQHSINNLCESHQIFNSCSNSSPETFLPRCSLPTELEHSLVKPTPIKSSGLIQLLSSDTSDDPSTPCNAMTSVKLIPQRCHLQWGAPAIVGSYSPADNPKTRNNILTEVEAEPKLDSREQCLSTSHDLVTENPRLQSDLFIRTDSSDMVVKSAKARSNENLKFIENGSKLEEQPKNGKFNDSLDIVSKENAVIYDITSLNQTLPAGKTLHGHNKTSRSITMNKSYDANQSFPKMTKSQHTITAVREDHTVASVGRHVTDLRQISPEGPEELAPRNRRSVFGSSPPGLYKNQKFEETDDDNESEAEESPVKMKPSADLNGTGHLENLWSLLDASDDIGQIPSIKEVLFNCVTSSLCIVDPGRSGKIISVNESFQFLIGVHEKVMGQRLFRFIKFRDPRSNLGLSLPQSFVLADGQLTSVTGKLAYCVDASGEHIPVSVWTVPFKPQPKLTVCVIGASVCINSEVYLSQAGRLLMYSEPFEDILGLTKEKEVCRLLDLDFSQVGKSQNKILQAVDGCKVPVMVTVTASGDTSVDEETLGKVCPNNGIIYPAVISVPTNMSGLLIVRSNGVIQSCDKNYFRIHLGHSQIEGKCRLSDLLSDIIRVSQNSSQSSQNSSPSSQRESSTNLALFDVICLNSVLGLQAGEKEELLLPESCFSSQEVAGMQESDTDDSSDEVENYSIAESVFEELGTEDCAAGPYQTSTPCKSGETVLNGVPKKISMENGIYAAQFLHGSGYNIPVMFKMSSVQTSSATLFCLWVYIKQSKSKDYAHSDEEDDDDAAGSSSQSDDEGVENEAESPCDEDDLTNRLRHFHLDQPVDRTRDTSYGQLLMEHAGLNQSHNATSDADVLDLEAAVDGSFGQKYMVCEALGQGSFGFVRRVRVFGSKDTAVVKFIKKSKMFEDSWTLDTHNTGRQIPLEVAILKDASNEYIIKLLDVHENESFVQMIMEDFGETDLFDFIDQVVIDEALACHLFRQVIHVRPASAYRYLEIVWAVEYLHSQKIVHRDIKDENVIVSRNFHCKLIDFGSATYMLPEGQLFTKFRGTLEYCSPEVYAGEWYRGPELDIWALGVTLYTIIFRENPFSATEIPGRLDDLPHPVSEDLLTLMLGLLEPDLCKRFTILQALSCDWLRQFVDLSTYQWCELFGDVPVQCESMIAAGIDY